MMCLLLYVQLIKDKLLLLKVGMRNRKKMQQQIDEGDYKLVKAEEKMLFNKIHHKLEGQLKKKWE